jgi:hypothetical protein
MVKSSRCKSYSTVWNSLSVELITNDFRIVEITNFMTYLSVKIFEL